MLYKYKLLLETIDRMERRLWVSSALDTMWCANTITMLWKRKYITEAEASALADRVTAIIERNRKECVA